jgi:hypothetical protein
MLRVSTAGGSLLSLLRPFYKNNVNGLVVGGFATRNSGGKFERGALEWMIRDSSRLNGLNVLCSTLHVERNLESLFKFEDFLKRESTFGALWNSCIACRVLDQTSMDDGKIPLQL